MNFFEVEFPNERERRYVMDFLAWIIQHPTRRINYALLIATALCTYDLSFLYVMIYNLLTMLLIFLAVFRWKLWRLKHAVADEE